jgi:hypothetical protein
MLYVNTIEFDGRKAAINSYSIGYAKFYDDLRNSMVRQLQEWIEAAPNANVATETMSEEDCRALVANGVRAYDVATASNGKEN